MKKKTTKTKRAPRSTFVVSGKVQGLRLELLRLEARSQEAAVAAAVDLLPMGRVSHLCARPLR